MLSNCFVVVLGCVVAPVADYFMVCFFMCVCVCDISCDVCVCVKFSDAVVLLVVFRE